MDALRTECPADVDMCEELDDILVAAQGMGAAPGMRAAPGMVAAPGTGASDDVGTSLAMRLDETRLAAHRHNQMVHPQVVRKQQELHPRVAA